MKIVFKLFRLIVLGFILVNSAFGLISLNLVEKPKLLIWLPHNTLVRHYRFSTEKSESIKDIEQINLYAVVGYADGTSATKKLSDSALKLVEDGANPDTDVNAYLGAHIASQVSFNLVDSMLPSHPKLELLLVIKWQNNKDEDKTTTFGLVRGSAEEIGAKKTDLQTLASDAYMVIPGLPPTVDIPLAKEQSDSDTSVEAAVPIDNAGNADQDGALNIAVTAADGTHEVVRVQPTVDQAIDPNILARWPGVDIPSRQGWFPVEIEVRREPNWTNLEERMVINIYTYENGRRVLQDSRVIGLIPPGLEVAREGNAAVHGHAYIEFTNHELLFITLPGYPNNRVHNFIQHVHYIYDQLAFGIGYYIIATQRTNIIVNTVTTEVAKISFDPTLKRALAVTPGGKQVYAWDKDNPEPIELSIPADSKGSNLVKDIEATKNGDFVLMEDGKTIDAEGYNGVQENLLGLGSNVDYQASLAKVDLSQINFAPNEQFDHFANDANINNEDQVAVVSTLSRYLGWGLNIMGRLTGTLPRWVTDTGVTAYGTTLKDNFYKIYNIHTHKFDWRVCGVWGKFMGSTALMGASNASNAGDFVPCDPDHAYTLFSTSI